MKKVNVNELIKMLDKHKFKQFHIHHTWRPNHSNFKGNNHMQMQQGMKNYHVNTNGWQDIGQHATLFPDGAFVTGRPFNVAPASIKGWNTGAFALEMIGNFDNGHDKLTGKQKENLLKLIKYFANKYGRSSIKFHREGPGVSKTCPGTSLNKNNLINEAMKKKEDKPIKTNKVKISLHGKQIEVEGFKKDNVNYIPVRTLEKLGYEIGWNNKSETVLVDYKGVK